MNTMTAADRTAADRTAADRTAADRTAYVAICRWHLRARTVYARRANRTDLDTMRTEYGDRATLELFRARWCGVTPDEFATADRAEEDAVRAEIRTGAPRPIAEIDAISDGYRAACAHFRAAYPERFR